MVKTICYPQTKQYMQSLLKYADAAQDICAAEDFLMQTRAEMMELGQLPIDLEVARRKQQQIPLSISIKSVHCL